MAFYTVLVLLALLGLHLYVLVPLEVGRRRWWWASPDVVVLSPDDPRFPDWARTFFDRVSPELSVIGFQPVACLLCVYGYPHAARCLAFFLSPGEPGVATAIVGEISTRRGAVRWGHEVAFGVVFRDDVAACTSNTRALPLISDPRKRIWRFPAMADLGFLYRIHKALTENDPSETENPVREPADFVRAVHDDLVHYYRSAVEAGYMCLAVDGQTYRLTTKGALLAVNNELPPTSMVRRWLVKRTARRLLRELGLPTTYATVDYAADEIP